MNYSNFMLIISLIFYLIAQSRQEDNFDNNVEFPKDETYGSCETPNEIAYNEKRDQLNSQDIASTELYGLLTHKVSHFKSTCFTHSDSNRVYQFELHDHVYIELKLKEKSENADLYATITDTSCQIEYQCVSLSNEEPSIVYLGSGNYNLIINGILHEEFHYNGYSKEIQYVLSFKAYKEAAFKGSYANPILLDQDINFIFNSKKILENNFNQNSYYTKLDCSGKISPSIVYSFEISKETELLLDIKLYSKSNKLDTVLGIADSSYNNNNLNIENWCNDDSDKIGGLSSYLNGILAHGKYKLIASGYDNETYGQFILDFKSNLYKIGSIGPIVLDNSIKKKFNGSFTHNKNEFKCNCCIGKQSIRDYIVIPLTVTQGKTMSGFIKVYGANKKNKLDTFIEIRDEYLESYLESGNLCNDDSSIVGGLSSFLNVLLTSGDYKLVIGSLESKRLANFTLEFNILSV